VADVDGGVVPYGNALAAPAVLGLGVVVATVMGADNAGASSPRRWAAGLLSLGAFALPFAVEPEHVGLRFFTAMGTVMVVIRTADLLRDRRRWSWRRRAWLMLSVWDSRQAIFVEDRFDLRAWLSALGFGVLAMALGVVAWWASSQPVTATMLLLRWLAGGLFAYATFDALHALLIGLNRMLAVVVPPFHRHPLRSRSLAEFWGERWNLIIHQALARHVFMPFARRRHAKLGFMLAFLASAAIHFWLMFAALNAVVALCMGAFFLVQGVLIGVERRLGVRQWQPRWGHVWTVLAILLPSPLFTEPLLRVMGFPTPALW
jgi:Membrane bound O-acyl transferase family